MLQQEKSEITINKILASAEEEFSKKGLFGARVDAISKNAGVNKQMIYRHFESKEKLYSSVLIMVYERLTKREISVFESEKEDPKRAIRKIVCEYFDFLKNNSTFVRLIMWENLNDAAFLKASGAIDLKQPFISAIKDVLSSGQKMGVFKKDVSEKQLMLSLLSSVFSYFSNIHTMSTLLDFDMADTKNINDRIDWVCESVLNKICV